MGLTIRGTRKGVEGTGQIKTIRGLRPLAKDDGSTYASTTLESRAAAHETAKCGLKKNDRMKQSRLKGLLRDAAQDGQTAREGGGIDELRGNGLARGVVGMVKRTVNLNSTQWS